MSLILSKSHVGMCMPYEISPTSWNVGTNYCHLACVSLLISPRFPHKMPCPNLMKSWRFTQPSPASFMLDAIFISKKTKLFLNGEYANCIKPNQTISFNTFLNCFSFGIRFETLNEKQEIIVSLLRFRFWFWSFSVLFCFQLSKRISCRTVYKFSAA